MRQLLFIPCKPFLQAKTRLSPVLDTAQRVDLARALYVHTLSVVSRSTAANGGAFEAIVISSDAEVLALARKAGLDTLVEAAAIGLNEALRMAMGCFPHHADVRYAYLPTDLPDLNSADLDALYFPCNDACIIAPDLDWHGTNFLAWPVQFDIELALGFPCSFITHYSQARCHTPHVRVITERGLCRDLDIPADLLQDSHRGSSKKQPCNVSRFKRNPAMAAAKIIEELQS